MRSALPSIRTVAKKAGVSTTTVSRVLNNSPIPSEETRRKVMKVIEKLDYRPDPVLSQATRNRMTAMARGEHPAVALKSLGLSVGRQIILRAQKNDGYYSRLLGGVHQVAHQREYRIITEPALTDQLPRMVMENLVGGILVDAHLPETLLRSLARRLPVVTIDKQYDLPGISAVMPDVAGGVAEIMEELWGLGHRRMLPFLVTTHPQPHDSHYLQAFKGFYAGKNEALPFAKMIRLREISPKTNEAVLSNWLDEVLACSPRPTALLMRDVYALTVIAMLKKRGLAVPRDITVVGMDNMGLATTIHPPLSTYGFPMDEMARLATEHLVRRMEDATVLPAILKVSGQLFRQGTSGRAPVNAN